MFQVLSKATQDCTYSYFTSGNMQSLFFFQRLYEPLRKKNTFVGSRNTIRALYNLAHPYLNVQNKEMAHIQSLDIEISFVFASRCRTFFIFL